MTYLNKIVFINSASIRYREILLDGNIHFIGTQGVGKSTVLRAILFFYNGNSQKLGISKEKKNFTEYYLPHADSAIIYELHSEDGDFCVWLYRSHNKLAFRFLRTSYREDLFIDKGRAPMMEKQILALQDHYGMEYSRKIRKYEEYRDIIYGVNREFLQFSLLQSSHYHNIPRTITNVFLNSGLSARFIKQTIIDSIEDSQFSIELDVTRRYLAEFERDYTDIKTFRDNEELAQSVVTCYHGLQDLDKKQKELAHQIGGAYNFSKKQIGILEQKVEKLSENESEILEQNDNLKREHKEAVEGLQEQIISLRKDLRKAKKLEKEYKGKGIPEILQRVERKVSLIYQKKHFIEEKNRLTTQFESIEQEFQVKRHALVNEQEHLESSSNQQINELRSSFLDKKDEVKNLMEERLKEVRESHLQKLEESREQERETQRHLQELEKEQVALQHQTPFQEQIEDLRKQLEEVRQESTRLEGELRLQKRNEETARQEWAYQKERQERDYEQEKENLVARIMEKKEAIQGIDEKLENWKDSLYSFLNTEQPNWMENIGRLLDDTILFRKDLEPQQVSEDQTLFGVALNLDNLECRTKSQEEYLTEQKKLAGEEQELKTRLEDRQEKFSKEERLLENNFSRKIGELHDQVKELSYRLEKNQLKENSFSSELENLRKKGQEEKLKNLEVLKDQLAAQKEKAKKVHDALKELHEAQQEQETGLITDQRDRLKNLEQELKVERKKIEASLKDKLEEVTRRLKEVDEAKYAKMEGRGLDTDQLGHLEHKISELEHELEYIYNNEALVIEYRKDKRELIDKIDDFQSQLKKHEQEMQYCQTQYDRQEKEEFSRIKELQELVSSIKSQLKNHRQQVKEFNDMFLNSGLEDWLKQLAIHEQVLEDVPSLSQLNVTLTGKTLERQKETVALQEKINQLGGYFEPENKLGLDLHLEKLPDYYRFSESLQNFMNHDVLVDMEREVEKQFALLVGKISRDVKELTGKEGRIEETIAAINKDFRKSNFVGVVKKIEMRMKESANKVVQILKKIQEFNEEYALDLGEMNLFNADNSREVNKQAIGLLNKLLLEIRQRKAESITLSDAFELEFRVVENDNDTHWVENLSNVGSNGTDVLIKAMIYIMLLNVFKEAAGKNRRDFMLHCIIDEVGILHDSNIKGLIDFASERNIYLINGSPNTHNETDYRHVYKFYKDANSLTQIRKLISVKA